MELLASGDSDLGEASPPRYWRLGINPLAAPPRRWRAPEPARTRRRSNAGPVLKGMRQSAPPPAREGLWRGLEAAATRRVAHTWPVPEKNPLAAPPRRWRVPEPARTRRRSNAGPILKGIRQSAPPPAREGLWRGLEAAATRQVVHTWPVPNHLPPPTREVRSGVWWRRGPAGEFSTGQVPMGLILPTVRGGFTPQHAAVYRHERLG